MALSRDRSLTIAAKVGLGAEELSKPCEEYLFPLLAKFVHPWRLVFSSLLSEVDLDDIDKESQSEQEKRVAALRKWKTRDGHKANYGVLVKVVLDNGKVDQAELLCQLLALQPPSDDQGTVMPDSSSTVPCQQSPLSPRPSPTPPLSSTTPATEHFAPVSTSLEEEIKRLDEEYIEIESVVLETIKLRNVPHKTMLKWIQVLPMTLKSQFSELLQRNAKALSSASNVDELFFIVSPYWNSFHPTLLEHLIKKLADDKLKSRMIKYTNDLCKFRVHTRLGDFIDWTGGFPPGYEEFVVKFGEEWRERTVEDLEQFRIRLSRQQCIGGHISYMKKVMPGSIFVELALPQCCFPLNFDKDIQKFLRDEDVLGVYVKGKCIIDLHQPEVPSDNIQKECDSETEPGAMAVVETTAWSDSETSSVYSNDRDVEYQEQLQPSDEEVHAAEADYDSSYTMFPSSSSVNLRFLYRTPDGISIISPQKEEGISPRFRITPLRRTGEVELQIEMKAGASFKDIEIGLERCTKHTLDESSTSVQFLYPSDQFTESSCIFSICGAVFNYLKRNSSVDISYSQDKFSLLKGVNQIGLKLTRDGALEFFMNGQSQGIAAEGVYKLGRNVFNHPSTVYYPMLWLPFGNNKAVLIAGAAQTEVLSLQQLCIDCVASTLSSPKNVHFLPLPDNIKKKIAKVAFDPAIDMSFDPGNYSRHSSHDKVIDQADYKKLISKLR